MIEITKVSDSENVFLFNGREVPKNYEARATGVDESVEIVAVGKDEKLQKAVKYDQYEIDGIVASSVQDAVKKLNRLVFKKGGGNEANGVAEINDDSVTYDKLGAEFTTITPITALDVDFATAQVFTKTLTEDTTLTFSNTQIGMVKDLVITGDFSLNLPAGNIVAGVYNGTVSNLIQVVVTNVNEYWFSISQPQ